VLLIVKLMVLKCIIEFLMIGDGKRVSILNIFDNPVLKMHN
jgi:hypothetical protein